MYTRINENLGDPEKKICFLIIEVRSKVCPTSRYEVRYLRDLFEILLLKMIHGRFKLKMKRETSQKRLPNTDDLECINDTCINAFVYQCYIFSMHRAISQPYFDISLHVSMLECINAISITGSLY